MVRGCVCKGGKLFPLYPYQVLGWGSVKTKKKNKKTKIQKKNKLNERKTEEELRGE